MIQKISPVRRCNALEFSEWSLGSDNLLASCTERDSGSPGTLDLFKKLSAGIFNQYMKIAHDSLTLAYLSDKDDLPPFESVMHWNFRN